MDDRRHPLRRGPGIGWALRLALLAPACLLLASCRTLPPPGPAPLPGAAPLPARFTARQTVVFEFRPHWWWPRIPLTALGYASVDRQAGAFTVVCLSPLGVKLFDVTRTNGQTRVNATLPLPGEAEQTKQAIGDDIALLYLDLAPPPEATAVPRGDQVVFRHTEGEATAEWVYAAGSGRLLARSESGPAGRRTVTYDDYHPLGDSAYPATLTLRNHRYRYRLLVRIWGLQPEP